MQNIVEAEEPEKKEGEYVALLIELEEQKHNYKQELRPLLWYRNIFIAFFIVLISAIVTIGIFGQNTFIGGWATFVIIASSIILLGLIIFLLLDETTSAGTKVGFKGFSRVKDLMTSKEETDTLEMRIQVMKAHQTLLLSTHEQLELYKDEVFQVTDKYTKRANRNRNYYYILQLIIIFASLLVTGLTSGLTNLVYILHLPWITPFISFMVSFLTAMVTLFRPKERGYNLQQTADAIEYEIACSNRRIYGYKGLDTGQVYTKLAEEIERLRNEQRKRQQQLEQASEVKHSE
ncbi:MAG TPA: DUF4231 domain-containing protein [Ktedonobacteraceae bacterium]|nr:DUF4231 domain-containing protein [Ktedonobacteraceae bacterium]